MDFLQQLSNVNNACDEFLSGKYILADIKISSILKIIDSSSDILKVVSTCMEDYDFASAFAESIHENEDGKVLVLPSTDAQIVAFTYSLLQQIKNQNIPFNDFLKEYYSSTDFVGTQEYNYFSTAVILPFKKALNNLCARYYNTIQEDNKQIAINNNLKANIKLIADNVNNYKLSLNEKEEFVMLLNSLFLACDKNDKKLIYSLMVGLDYFSKFHKKTRNAYLALEDCF